MSPGDTHIIVHARPRHVTISNSENMGVNSAPSRTWVLLDFLAPDRPASPATESPSLPWHPFQTPLFSALLSTLERVGFGVSVGLDTGIDDLARFVKSGRYRGLVTNRSAWSGAPASRLLDLFKPVPTVSFGRGITGGTVHHVGLDDRGAVEGLLHLLARAGRHHPAFVAAAIPKGISETATHRRFHAFRNFLRERGRPCGPAETYWFDTGKDFWKGEGLARFLRGPGRNCDALVCANDQIAFRALEVLRNLGRSVPDDLAVTGIDGFHSNPGPEILTTMALDARRIAEAVAARLQDLMENRPLPPGRMVSLPPRRIPGNTVMRKPETIPAPPDRTEEMEKWLMTHLDETDPIAGLSQTLSVQRIQVLRVWRRNRREGLGPWLARQRLARAKALLERGGMELERVAMACGFTNRRTFHRQFRAAFGLPPGVWRQQNRRFRRPGPE